MIKQILHNHKELSTINLNKFKLARMKINSRLYSQIKYERFCQNVSFSMNNITLREFNARLFHVIDLSRQKFSDIVRFGNETIHYYFI